MNPNNNTQQDEANSNGVVQPVKNVSPMDTMQKTQQGATNAMNFVSRIISFVNMIKGLFR